MVAGALVLVTAAPAIFCDMEATVIDLFPQQPPDASLSEIRQRLRWAVEQQAWVYLTAEQAQTLLARLAVNPELDH